MTHQIVAKLKDNVIQGRKTQADEGIDEGFSGTPGVQELTEAAIEAKIAPDEIVNEALTGGMQVVGEKFEAKEYFIPDMLASAEAVEVAMDILKPLLAEANIKPKAKLAIATVKGDIHDIGKNILAIMLKGAGYEVEDLGIDVSAEKIVDYVKNENPDYIGLSALLTTMLEMKVVIEALKEASLREKVKILIGGAAVSDEYAEEIGADAFCLDAFTAIKTLDSFTKA